MAFLVWRGKDRWHCHPTSHDFWLYCIGCIHIEVPRYVLPVYSPVESLLYIGQGIPCRFLQFLVTAALGLSLRLNIQLSTLRNLDSLHGLIARCLLDIFDLLNNVVALKNFTKDNVAAIQPSVTELA